MAIQNEEKRTPAASGTGLLSWAGEPGTILHGKYHAGGKDAEGYVRAHFTVTIMRDPQVLYQLWSDVEKAPLWQERVTSVTRTGAQSTHWIMKMPMGVKVEWDSELVDDTPGKKIAWRSTGGDIEQAGEVTFTEPTPGRGTVVRLVQEFKMPKSLAAAAGVLARSPEQTVKENLRHFKQLAETGEIPTTEGQPHGPRGVSGKAKEAMYGETNPTPPGTQSVAKDPAA